jgi:hypothetical protein
VQLGRKRQDLESQVPGPRQRAEIAQAFGEGRPPGAQSQPAPAARAVHFFQGAIDRREIREIKLAFQVIRRIVIDQVRKARQLSVMYMAKTG